jgi:acyl dehydratase
MSRGLHSPRKLGSRSLGMTMFSQSGEIRDGKSMMLETPNALKEYVGREIAVTEWFAITQERIQAFADTTEDRQWIHVDEKRAKQESPFGTTVAHGFLTLSLLSRFIREGIQIKSGVRLAINYGLNRVRFPAPVRVGAKVRARIGVASVNALPDAAEATYHVVMEVEGSDKPCCVAEWVVRYYS